MKTSRSESPTRYGKHPLAVLAYEESSVLQEALADAEDLRELRAAKLEEGTAPTVSLQDIKVRYGED